MEKVIILRYGEIHLKGANRGYFEHVLIQNIKKMLGDLSYKLTKISGRYLIEQYNLEDEEIFLDKLTKIFGIYSLSVGFKVPTNLENIENVCKNLDFNTNSFKVITNRADKTFAIKSMELSKLLGEKILSWYPNLKVDVHNPSLTINIDIREDGNTYISSNNILCAGGMPVSTAGKGVLLLSGGIDSPVAGYFMARRGLKIDAIHFHSYPYTSLLAREKVIKLAKKMSNYCGNINLHIISFTKIQEAINKNCDKDYMVVLMRRFMMRIAEKIANKNDAHAIVTGESLGQVASQTLESINATNAVVSMPVFRPLIGLDKLDIISVSKKIDTYDISIEPYEDCCTVFLPKNPVTKPKIDKVISEEEKLNIKSLIDEALASEEIIKI